MSSWLKLSYLFNETDPQNEAKFKCESMAPFGGPVVPLVLEKVKQS